MPATMAETNPSHCGSSDTPVARLLSYVEVAVIFVVDYRTLLRWEKAWHLLPARIDLSIFYRRDDIERLIAHPMTVTALVRLRARRAFVAAFRQQDAGIRAMHARRRGGNER
jgi:hypothetical protein